MATKKDLDDILNNNAKVKKSKSNNKKRTKSDVDNMSVDDVLNSLGDKKSDTPKKLAPLPPKKSTAKPASTENKTKKRIVISGELPDYDALRSQEIEKEKKRIESDRKAKEEAEKKRIEAEKKAKEEAEKKRIEAEKKAKEEAEKKRIEAEKKAKEEAEKKRIEAEKKAKEEAEKKRIEEETKRRMLEEAEEFTVEEITEISTSEKYDDDEYEEIEVIDETDDSDPVSSMIDNIREDAEKALADIENVGNDEEEEVEEQEDTPEEEEKPSGITAALENILDENPDEIINERREKPEADKKKKPKLRLKKNIYTFFGLIFAVLACVGFVSVVAKGVSLIGGFSSGNNKKTGFEPVVYPAVIMDIESFETPAELPSEQIITAAIWSMIMSDDAISNYEQTFDVVKIPAVDVELYAVKMFGENLPALNHATVGPAESRFYYNEETKSYNVPIAPVTYTYSPEIKGATKNDSTYTIVVDYIDELPKWLPKKSSKSVEFKLTETNDGYIINSMKVLSTSNNAL